VERLDPYNYGMSILNKNKAKIAIIALFIVVPLGVIAIKLPWLSVLLVITFLLFCVAVISTHDRVKIVMINIAAISFVFAAFEAYLGVKKKLAGDGTRMEGTITKGFTHQDDVVGYAPNKDSQVTARKLYGGSVIYDVVYTIGPDGLRTGPSFKEQGRRCIIFFGGSNTFGEGVNDQVPFPYRVGEMLGGEGEYRVYNFGFSGYGPHQMLAILQSGRLEQIVACSPAFFIYYSIPAHVARVAGLTVWDRHGPRFRLGRDGVVVRAGHFDYPYSGLLNYGYRAIASSLTRQAAAITQERYPGSEFHIILADDRNDKLGLRRKLENDKIVVHELISAIPDYWANADQYVLSVHDRHPNRRKHDMIAKYIVSQIVKHIDHKEGR
jgi:hypothetical protein